MTCEDCGIVHAEQADAEVARCGDCGAALCRACYLNHRQGLLVTTPCHRAREPWRYQPADLEEEGDPEA